MRDQYTRTSKCFILMFSITSRQSFEALQGYKDKISNTNQEKHHFVLCGNKSDLEGERVVRDEEAEELARGWGCPFVRTSAKTGMNVEEMFVVVCREMKKGMESGKEGKGKKGREMKEEKSLEERQYEARKALLKDLLRDGVISSAIFEEYNQRNKTSLGIKHL
uniref:Uncharacterized protein n=1 Tax=Arcella intermedia TaxID=1963864 RepID=A0A6B2LGR5_9EUKA